jgi:hypothetical protein
VTTGTSQRRDLVTAPGEPGFASAALDVYRLGASGGEQVLCIAKPASAYNELAALTKDQVVALELGKVLSDSGSRRTYKAGKVPMA